MMKERVFWIDFVRSISILYVVAFWHLMCYDKSVQIYTPLGSCITDVVMASFMFISGLLVSRNQCHNFADVKQFYVKKFWRIYILYFVSVTVMYIGGYWYGNEMFSEGVKQYFLTILGLTSIFPPHAGQFWFVSMLILFYLLTPLIINDLYKLWGGIFNTYYFSNKYRR